MKMLGTGDAPGKAVPLPDTVRGRAEHGGQDLGQHTIAILAFRIVVESSICKASPSCGGAQLFLFRQA